LSRAVPADSICARRFSDTGRTRMPLLTVRAVEAHRPRTQPYKITLDRGLQLRIAPDGKRTLLVRYTVKGADTERQYRLPQEYGESPGQLKLADACAEAARIRALARSGVDWSEAEDVRLRSEAASRAALQRKDGLTLKKALQDYVENKRRAKDGLALKARTRSDYLAMVEPTRTTEKGTRQAAGFLHPIAGKALSELTASDIREAYDAAAKNGWRGASALASTSSRPVKPDFLLAPVIRARGAYRRDKNCGLC
jgi:hypothetical protein